MKIENHKRAGLEAAYQTKTITKEQAYNALQELEKYLDRFPDEVPESVWQAFGRASRYFAPKAAKKAATDNMTWLFSACGNKDGRKALKFVQVMDGVGVATDGQRLHKAPVNMPDGYYHKSGTFYTPEDFEKEIGRFLNWKQVIPYEADYKVLSLEGCTRSKRGKTWEVRPAGDLWQGSSLNEALLNELMADCNGVLTANTGVEPVVYRSGDRYGVLMPIRTA